MVRPYFDSSRKKRERKLGVRQITNLGLILTMDFHPNIICSLNEPAIFTYIPRGIIDVIFKCCPYLLRDRYYDSYHVASRRLARGSSDMRTKLVTLL